jgi:ElaB/YqjD/DUF883 family membrane-anchored ribosome-binding protein
MGFLSPARANGGYFMWKETKLMPSEILEMPAAVEEALREVGRIKAVVTEAVEDGMKSAMKAIKQGRYAAEDMIGDARHTVRRKPFQAVGVVFAVGLLTGTLIGWLASSRD